MEQIFLRFYCPLRLLMKMEKKEIKNDQIKFYYRGTNLPKNYIILSAVLKGTILKNNGLRKNKRN